MGSTNADGLFDLAGAVTGSYLLVASSLTMSGLAPVDIGGGDVSNVPIVIHEGFRVSGRFIIEGGSLTGNDPRVTDLRVDRLIRDPDLLAMPPGGPRFNPPPLADGSFVLEGVGPGSFRLNIRSVPPDAYVKSIRMGKADVHDGGLHVYSPPEDLLEITIGVSAGRVDGFVVNSARSRCRIERLSWRRMCHFAIGSISIGQSPPTVPAASECRGSCQAARSCSPGSRSRPARGSIRISFALTKIVARCSMSLRQAPKLCN